MGIVTRHEGDKVNSDINVTPMVDVMLVLLIIFMVIVPMLNHKVQITLVRSKNALAMKDASKSDAVIVAVTRDNKVYLGSNEVTFSALGTDVTNDLQNKTNKIVYIRADARAQYETVENAVDAVRTAGVEQLGLLTDQPQDGPPPPPSAGE